METFLVLLALIVACTTLFVQRQHNRKELLPIIHTYFSADVRDEWLTREFKLINDGNGVAILKKIILHLENEDIGITHFNDFSRVIEEKLPQSKDVSTSLPFCVSASSSEVMYRYTIPVKSNDLLNGVSITVVCESVYGDIVEANSKGFEVRSNNRDLPFEYIFSKCADLCSAVLGKATNKTFKSDS